ncbi:hypothetical protein F0562_005164 [Nyssa sinensis]|uniref:Pectinesterase inhibitor domain-containing protein n=1 Tax=Nyssa sinensis TaxID=561372 RepID=A0A5J5AHB5_9ASTE|nr:hypothetical protein F0562_005164 [Nyssa sinensis]
MGMVGKKTFFLAFLVMTVSATATNLSGAAVSSQRTELKSWCKGAIDECLEEEVEYLMDSDVNARLLQQGGKDPFTDSSKIRTAGPNCSRRNWPLRIGYLGENPVEMTNDLAEHMIPAIKRYPATERHHQAWS